MSRIFNGTDTYLQGSISGALSGRPFTVGAWIRRQATGVAHGIGGSSDVITSGAHGNILFWNNANVPGFTERTGSTANVTGGASTDLDNWHLFVGICVAAAERIFYFDSVKTTNTTDIGALNAQEFLTIGARVAGATTPPDLLFNGFINHAMIWDSQLSDSDVASLFAGTNPLSVDSENLVAYWPTLGSADPEIDIVNGFELALFGTDASSAEEPEVESILSRNSFHDDIICTQTPAIARVTRNPWIDSL